MQLGLQVDRMQWLLRELSQLGRGLLEQSSKEELLRFGRLQVRQT